LAVIVENGGHGGSAAGPIARKVMDYYLLGKLPAVEPPKVEPPKVEPPTDATLATTNKKPNTITPAVTPAAGTSTTPALPNTSVVDAPEEEHYD
jgi:hypothetical protein